MEKQAMSELILEQVEDVYNTLWQDIGGLESATPFEIESFLKDLALLIKMIEENPETAAKLFGSEAWESDLKNLKYHAIEIKNLLPTLLFAEQKLGEIDEPLSEHLRSMSEIEREIDEEECGVCKSDPCRCGGNGRGFRHVGGII